MVEIASLDEVPLRSVWRDEARDFTPWLAANPDLLGKELQMDLELEGKEVLVGTFSADLVLRDTNTSQRVVVENLLETTDHDHLGKLITYAAALEARWAVLVAPSLLRLGTMTPRPAAGNLLPASHLPKRRCRCGRERGVSGEAWSVRGCPATSRVR